MKRLTLLTILLVVVGLTAGALEVKPAFALTGTGTLQWGIDLDDMGTGFKNSATGDLVITLMAKDGSDTHAGTGDWYGSISIANMELYWTDGTVTAGGVEANVTAKIVGMGGDLTIGVVPVAGPTGPDLTLDFVAAIENDDSTDDDLVVDNELDNDIASNYDGFGTYVSYNISEALMVGLELVSQYDWTANETNGYAGALDIQAKFAPLTINAGVNYGTYKIAKVAPLWDDDVRSDMGFGVKVAADTAMVDGWVGFDGNYDTAFAWEVGAGVTVTLMETVTAAVSVVYGDPQFDNLDVKFVFTEPAAKGLVDNLDATLTVYVLDVGGLAGLEYEAILAAGYLMGKAYPHFGVTYGDTSGASDAFMKVYVHFDYTLFDAAKTVLSLGWDSGDLLATTPVMGAVVAGVTITY